MPFHPERYPENWKEISKRVRERDGNRCKWCGAENHQPHPKTGKKVILTVAHLHGTDTMTQDESLMVSLCQPCHLTYDAKEHARNARRTKIAKTGQLELMDGHI